MLIASRPWPKPRLAAGVFLTKLSEKVATGMFAQEAAARGAGVWTPLPLRYIDGTQGVCIPSVGATGCPAGPWNPSEAQRL